MKYEVHTSLLVLPTRNEELRLLNRKIADNPVEICALLCEFPQFKFEYFEIKFSVFSTTVFQDQPGRIIDITSQRRLVRSQEVNELMQTIKLAL